MTNNFKINSIIMKTSCIFLFFLISNNIWGREIDMNYQLIYKAESHIMKNEYDSAIMRYNESYRLKPLPKTSVYQYLTLLELDSILEKNYFDTLLYYLASHSQNIERYSTFKIVEKAIKEKRTKLFPLKDLEQNFTCSEFEGILMNMVRERNKNSESIDSSSKSSLDSAIYFSICDLIRMDKYKPCVNLLFENSQILQAIINYRKNVKNYHIDSIFERLMNQNIIDRTLVGKLSNHIILNDYKNSRTVSEMDIIPTVEVFQYEMVYQDIFQKELIDTVRSIYNIEPYSDFISKIKWQLENNFLLTRIPVFRVPIDDAKRLEEANTISKLLSDSTRKYQVYKFVNSYENYRSKRR